PTAPARVLFSLRRQEARTRKLTIAGLLKQANAEMECSDVLPGSCRLTLTAKSVSQALQIETIVENEWTDRCFNSEPSTCCVAEHCRVKFTAICPEIARVHEDCSMHRATQGDTHVGARVDEDISAAEHDLSNG